MAIASLFANARSLAAIVHLLGELGVSGQVRPLHPSAIPGSALRHALRLERAGLPWLLLESGSPGATARRTARQAMRRGDTVAVLALGADSIALTVALDRVVVREIPQNAPASDDLALLSRLRECTGPSALEAAVRLAGLLELEPAGQRFVRGFRAAHALVAAAFPAGPGPLDRHALALLQLTRVLFLYFVQSKGWLAGEPDYLARGIDACLGQRKQIHRDFLHPLFFGTLNQPALARGVIARRLGPLPYLNGGLFEPHPLERRWRSRLPNEVWRDVFDDLFERFAFCTREGGGERDIAPDMLGRVFEGIMDPEARQRSGTFYTPPGLVTLLLHEGLCAVLQAALAIPYREAAERLAQPDAAVQDRLRRFTLIDPAAGSGAFLLAGLQQLAELTRLSTESVAQARRRTLCHSIYGVDLNPVAVRLAELRLWLAVIAEDTEADPAQVQPLPNLDSLVRQGDSLSPTLGLVASSGPGAQRLRDARADLFRSTGDAKRAALRTLRAAERAAALESLAAGEALAAQRVRDAIAALRSPDLFGRRTSLNEPLRQALTDARTELRQLHAERRRLALHHELPVFDFAVHFADVLSAGGFDMVIGNPPWVRGESLPARLRERLNHRYRWFRRSGAGWRNAPDLSIAFLERSLEITRAGGTVAMLVPAKLCTAGYASVARHALATETTLHLVAPIPEEKPLRFEATTYPLALVTSRNRPSAVHEVRTTIGTDQHQVSQAVLRSGAPWILRSDPHDGALAELAAAHPPLSSAVRIQLGVKTGADRHFLTDLPDIEPELMRRAVRGRDIREFRVATGQWLRWPCDDRGQPLRKLPPLAAAHFTRCDSDLRARTDYQGGPPWTLFRTRAATAPYRVVWSDLAQRLRAVALIEPGDANLIPLNTCYVVALPDAGRAAALAAWLNSHFACISTAQHAVPAANGYRRFTASTVGALPFPADALQDSTLADLARAARAGDDVSRELEDRVTTLLGLGNRHGDLFALAGSATRPG